MIHDTVVLVVALAALTFASPGAAQAPDAERQAAVMAQTVLDQLAAFRIGDWAGAYAFAAASIQARFSPEAFREMVTRGYAPIARSARGTVRSTEVVDPQHGYVLIRVEGQDGETVDAVYELIREQGAWKIAGVLASPVERGVTARPGRSLSHPVVLGPRRASQKGATSRRPQAGGVATRWAYAAYASARLGPASSVCSGLAPGVLPSG